MDETVSELVIPEDDWEDFIIEDTMWSIRYLVIDTRNWLPGRKVLISPFWVEDIHWAGKAVSVNKNMESVEKSPEYDPQQPVNLEYEVRLYDYYGRPARVPHGTGREMLQRSHDG